MSDRLEQIRERADKRYVFTAPDGFRGIDAVTPRKDVEWLLDEVDRLRQAIVWMAEDNSPHDAQWSAQNEAAKWEG